MNKRSRKNRRIRTNRKNKRTRKNKNRRTQKKRKLPKNTKSTKLLRTTRLPDNQHGKQRGGLKEGYDDRRIAAFEALGVNIYDAITEICIPSSDERKPMENCIEKGKGGSAIIYAAKYMEDNVVIKNYYKEEFFIEGLEGFVKTAGETCAEGVDDVENILNGFIGYGYEPSSKNIFKFFIVLKDAGDELFDLISDESLNTPDILKYSLPVLRQLVCLHERNLVHRDVKLENICYNETGSTLIDWDSTTESSQIWKEVLATEHYAAPELLDIIEEGEEGNEHDLKPADMFAFGVSLYTMFNSRYPFNRSSDGVDRTTSNNPQRKRIENHDVLTSNSTKENSEIFKTLITNNLLVDNDMDERFTAQETINFLCEHFKKNFAELFKQKEIEEVEEVEQREKERKTAEHARKEARREARRGAGGGAGGGARREESLDSSMDSPMDESSTKKQKVKGEDEGEDGDEGYCVVM